MYHWCLVAAVALLAPGVINPRFTPADLVRTSARILVLRAAAPKEGALAAEVVQTLKGAPLAHKLLKLELAEDAEDIEDDLAAAFRGKPTTTAIAFLSPGEGNGKQGLAGALQVDTQWFALAERGGKWVLDEDEQQLVAVWAGSARQLAEAARLALAEPGTTFPVRADMAWGGDARLGSFGARTNACLALDLGGAIGPCAAILADAGDRLLKAGAARAEPLKLPTASRLAAPGDFDGDGLLDLATWDGKALTFALQTPQGEFAARKVAVELPECLSLHAVDCGPGIGLLAGTRGGPMLVVQGADGAFAARRVAGADGLGPGGFCLPADLDGDGRCDIVQFHPNGMAVCHGEGQGRFRPPVAVNVPLPKSPSAAVCGDYDADGQLDLVVCGEDGLALLARGLEGRWENATHATGELAYHGNANEPRILAAAPCDINGDGRQGVALFYADRNPLVFFNRGFACFGLARELELAGGAAPDAPLDPLAPAPQARLEAARALQGGQATGTILDLNGDGMPDLFAVTPRGDAWVLFGKGAGGAGPLSLTVALPARARGPVTIGLSSGRRRIAMHVLRPGIPATSGLSEPGPVLIEWAEPDGTRRRREAIVERPTRIELVPEP